MLLANSVQIIKSLSFTLLAYCAYRQLKTVWTGATMDTITVGKSCESYIK